MPSASSPRVVRPSVITKRAVFGMTDSNRVKRQSVIPLTLKVVEERPCCAELLLMDNVDIQSQECPSGQHIVIERSTFATSQQMIESLRDQLRESHQDREVLKDLCMRQKAELAVLRKENNDIKAQIQDLKKHKKPPKCDDNRIAKLEKQKTMNDSEIGSSRDTKDNIDNMNS